MPKKKPERYSFWGDYVDRRVLSERAYVTQETFAIIILGMFIVGASVIMYMAGVLALKLSVYICIPIIIGIDIIIIWLMVKFIRSRSQFKY